MFTGSRKSFIRVGCDQADVWKVVCRHLRGTEPNSSCSDWSSLIPHWIFCFKFWKTILSNARLSGTVLGLRGVTSISWRCFSSCTTSCAVYLRQNLLPPLRLMSHGLRVWPLAGHVIRDGQPSLLQSVHNCKVAATNFVLLLHSSMHSAEDKREFLRKGQVSRSRMTRLDAFFTLRNTGEVHYFVSKKLQFEGLECIGCLRKMWPVTDIYICVAKLSPWVICFVYCKLTKLLIRGHTKLKEKMTFHYCVQLLAVQQKMKVKPFQDCYHMCTFTVGAFYFHVPY